MVDFSPKEMRIWFYLVEFEHYVFILKKESQIYNTLSNTLFCFAFRMSGQYSCFAFGGVPVSHLEPETGYPEILRGLPNLSRQTSLLYISLSHDNSLPHHV
jgi:hypothetical protein